MPDEPKRSRAVSMDRKTLCQWASKKIEQRQSLGRGNAMDAEGAGPV